jgi:hypothetical protein
MVLSALLLLYCCFTTDLLLLYYSLIAALLLLYFCFTAAYLLLYCCFTSALLLLYYKPSRGRRNCLMFYHQALFSKALRRG